MAKNPESEKTVRQENVRGFVMPPEVREEVEELEEQEGELLSEPSQDIRDQMEDLHQTLPEEEPG